MPTDEFTHPEAGTNQDVMFALDPTVRMVYTRLKSAQHKVQEQRREMRTSDKFYACWQWDETDLSKFATEERVGMVFNRAKRFVDIVVGTEINNRKEVRCIPRRPEKEQSSQYAELATDAIRYALQNCDGDDERTLVFFDAANRGMGWMEQRLDFTLDPDGQYIQERFDGKEAYWDTSSKKINLEDTRWRARRRNVLKKDIIARWPDKEDDIEAMVQIHSDLDEGLEVRNVEPVGYTGTQEVTDRRLPEDERWATVTQFQWWELEPIYRVLDPKTRSMITLDKKDYNKLSKRLGKSIEKLRAVRQQRRRYWQAFVVGDVLLEKEELPIQDGFTLKCLTGFRDEEKGIWFGLMRVLLDPQRAANKWLSQAIHILNTNAKNGYFAEAGAFLNPRKAEVDIAKPGTIVFTTPGAITQGKIQEKKTTQFENGYVQMIQYAVSSLHEVTGVTEGFTGDGSSDVNAAAMRQQQTQTITALAFLFMSLKKFRKEEARAILSFVREYLADGRLIRIGGEFNAQAIPLLREPLSHQYDIVLDEDPANPNTKMEVWSIIGQIAPALMQAGVFLPRFFDFSPLPASLVHDIKQDMEGKQQQQQEQQEKQMMMQLALKGKSPEETQARIAELEAKTQLEQIRGQAIMQEAGLTAAELMFKEREAKSKERIKEQESRAKIGREQGLANVKGMTELAKALMGNQQQNYRNGVPDGMPRVV